MDDWITVRQAAQILEVSVSRVYALISAGTITSKKLGLTTLVNRRAVAIYKESPSRNKFAGGNLRKLGEEETPSLFDPEQMTLPDDGSPWSGLNPPMLSVEARRLYDSSPRGEREARISSQGRRGEV